MPVDPNLLWIDYTIIGVYLLIVVIIGLIAQRRAKSNIDSYFLGGRNIPWWALAASGMASNLDVSGTMINTAIIYAFGMSGFFLEIRGGVTLVMPFLLAFMGKWSTRSEVMTTSELVGLRFGNSRDGHIARIATAVASIVLTVGAITYFSVGTGKFVREFLGIPDWLGLGDFWGSVLITALALIYTVTSGLNGVVWTDVFQAVIIFATIGIVVVKCMVEVTLPEVFEVSVPLKSGGFHPFNVTLSDWSSPFPKWEMSFAKESSFSVYNMYGVTIMFYLLRTTIEGLGGPTSYMAQRYYSCASEREATQMSFLWIFLLAFRWPFIMATAMYGVYYGTLHGVILDPEQVLPRIINEVMPIGLRGVTIAAMVSAAMSTFDSIVNAGSAYWVKDIYHAYISKKASERMLMIHSRVSSILIVVVGVGVTIFISNINDIWSWLQMAIGSGFGIPLFLRWYWYRINGYGFSAGIATGAVASIITKLAAPHLEEYYTFTIISSATTLVTVIVSLVTRPTDMATLTRFYLKIRPFGVWYPISRKVKPNFRRSIVKENALDIASLMFALPWQLVFFMGMMAFTLQAWITLGVTMAVSLIAVVALYFLQIRRMPPKLPMEPTPSTATLMTDEPIYNQSSETLDDNEKIDEDEQRYVVSESAEDRKLREEYERMQSMLLESERGVLKNPLDGDSDTIALATASSSADVGQSF